MKSPDEKKTRLVSTRMTQTQYEDVRDRAKKRNMRISSFIVDSAVHSDKQLNPHQVMQIHNLMFQAADACEATQSELAKQIRKEADALWQF